MVNDLALHGACEEKPSVRRSHVSGLHKGFVAAKLVGEFIETVVDEDGEEEVVRFGRGAECRKLFKDMKRAAFEEKVAKAAGGGGEERGGNVCGEDLIRDPGGFGKGAEDFNKRIPLNAGQLLGGALIAELAVDVRWVQVLVGFQ